MLTTLIFHLAVGPVPAAFAIDKTYLPRGEHYAAPRACGAVDYRAQLGPARVQGDSSYCFAYSSSNLLTQRTGVDASALDLATGFFLGDATAFPRRIGPFAKRELGPKFLARLPRETYQPGVDVSGPVPMLPKLEGGFEDTALAYVNARGVCPDANLPAEGGLDGYAAVVKLFTLNAEGGSGPVGREVAGISPRFRHPVADRFHTSWLRYARRACRARRSPVAILPVDLALAGTSHEFRERRATGTVGDGDQSRVLARLDYALDHGRVAAIGFDLNTVQARANYVEEDGDHSVAVVGRRAVDGECQYLIRDSAGYTCPEFLPSVRARCVDRHYWLNEAELRRSIYSVTYLR